MAKQAIISENVEITQNVGKSRGVPIGDYRNFLYQAIGKDFVDSMDYTGFQKWLFSHTGKTLKEVADEHNRDYTATSVDELLSENRFGAISQPDKEFIIAFDKAIGELGYDCENIITSGLTWSKFMIVYGKTGTKSRPCAARIFMKEDGTVTLRLFLNKVNKHRQYIESTPAHIKDAFIFTGGDCKSCNSACAPGKGYTIDGQAMQKCNHSTFYFKSPSVDKLPDYLGLLLKFFPVKK